MDRATRKVEGDETYVTLSSRPAELLTIHHERHHYLVLREASLLSWAASPIMSVCDNFADLTDSAANPLSHLVLADVRRYGSLSGTDDSGPR